MLYVIEKPKKGFISSHNKQILGIFHQSIFLKKVDKLLGSNHKMFLLTVKTHKQFFGEKRIKCRPINKSKSRSPVNIWIPSRDQNYSKFIACEILLEAHLSQLVCTGYNILNENCIF